MTNLSGRLLHGLDTSDEPHFTAAFFGLAEPLQPDIWNKLFEDVDVAKPFSTDVDVAFEEVGERSVADVVLRDNRQAVMVEVKIGASEGTDQLFREYQDLRDVGKPQDTLVYLTHHRTEPTDTIDEEIRKLEAAGVEDPHIVWMNWWTVDEKLYEYQQTLAADSVETDFVWYLREMLKKNGFASFFGMDTEVMERLSADADDREEVYEQFESLAGAVVSRLDAENTVRDERSIHVFNRDVSAVPVSWRGIRTPATGDADANATRGYSQAYLLLNESEGGVECGYSLRLGRSGGHPPYFDEPLLEHQESVRELVRSTGSFLRACPKYDDLRGGRIDVDELPSIIEGGEYRRLNVAKVFKGDDVADSDAVKAITEYLLELEDTLAQLRN